eukprot:1477291-Amphidinium_carterae.1
MSDIMRAKTTGRRSFQNQTPCPSKLSPCGLQAGSRKLPRTKQTIIQHLALRRDIHVQSGINVLLPANLNRTLASVLMTRFPVVNFLVPRARLPLFRGVSWGGSMLALFLERVH